MWSKKLKKFVPAVLIALLVVPALSFLACDNSPILGSTVVEPPDDDGNPDDQPAD